MSSFTVKHKTDGIPLDGPTDLRPEVKTSFITAKVTAEKKAVAAKKAAAKKAKAE